MNIELKLKYLKIIQEQLRKGYLSKKKYKRRLKKFREI
jgi:hypothetical protein